MLFNIHIEPDSDNEGVTVIRGSRSNASPDEGSNEYPDDIPGTAGSRRHRRRWERADDSPERWSTSPSPQATRRHSIDQDIMDEKQTAAEEYVETLFRNKGLQALGFWRLSLLEECRVLEDEIMRLQTDRMDEHLGEKIRNQLRAVTDQLRDFSAAPR